MTAALRVRCVRKIGPARDRRAPCWCWRSLFPLAFDPLATQMDVAIFVVAYVMMALGLNIVVGFAGLLDLGYVAFYAIGAYTVGWLASDHFPASAATRASTSSSATSSPTRPGIHLNFFLVLIAAMIDRGRAGRDHRPADAAPARRLHRDRDARLRRDHRPDRAQRRRDQRSASYQLTNGQQAISPVDQPYLPFVNYEFDSAFNLRPYYWLGLVLLSSRCS